MEEGGTPGVEFLSFRIVESLSREEKEPALYYLLHRLGDNTCSLKIHKDS